VAVSIVKKARKAGRPITKREITQVINSKKRAYIPEALEMAVLETGWLEEDGDNFKLGRETLPASLE
jgi:hypothetical protein